MPRTWKDVRAEAWHIRNPGFTREEDEGVWVVRATDPFEVDGITYTPPSMMGRVPGVSVSRPIMQRIAEPIWGREELESE